MYCKHCGAQIPDDSIFCYKCGQKLDEIIVPVEAKIIINKPTKKVDEKEWDNTSQLQWKKPTCALIIQIILLLTFLFWGIYGVYCTIDKGKVMAYRYGPNYDQIVIHDPLDILPLTQVKYLDPHQSTRILVSDKKHYDEYHAKTIFFVVVPSVLIIILSIVWMNKNKFPSKSTPLPRDLADEIEPYIWLGFKRSKLILFRKDKKWGIIDVAQYKVIIPAIYDSIKWRVPDDTIDVVENGEMKTISIND